MPTLAEDIQLFLKLHHRAHELTEAERAQYEALRERVREALTAAR